MRVFVPAAVELMSTEPPMVSVLALAVMVRVALMVTAPVPRLRSLVPVKVKLLFHAWTLFVESVRLEPLVLSSVAAALEIVRVPVPSADALLNLSVPPPLTVNPPLNVLVPAKVSAPVPVKAITPVLPELEF